MTLDFKLARQLRYYDACCAELAKRCGAAANIETWTKHSWWHRHRQAVDELASLPRPHTPLILVDDSTWEVGPIDGRKRVPFLERNGAYWGRPQDDAVAIAELERLRSEGASFIVIAWPAFWWLRHYAGFARHLRRGYPCILQNDRLVVFDLEPQESD
jgi:hypothetical protein